METLDKCFENVCELDLIFHMDKVRYLLSLTRVTRTLKPRTFLSASTPLRSFLWLFTLE